MNKPQLKANMQAAWLDRAQTIFIALVGVTVAVGLLKLASDPQHILAISIAVVFGYGAASLTDDLLTGLLSKQRERLYAAADAAGDASSEAAK